MKKQSLALLATASFISISILTLFNLKDKPKESTEELAYFDFSQLETPKKQLPFSENSYPINEPVDQPVLIPLLNPVPTGKFLNNSLPTITPAPLGNGGNAPNLLSQTGAFTNLVNLVPAPELIPYDMIEPFWSDGAEKSRWMVIPNDGNHDSAEEQIVFSNTDAWDFPKGSVLIKHFELGGKRLETRFEIKGDDDVFYYLTYKWNDAQTNATLLNDAVDEDVIVNGITQSWHYPSRAECASCHFPQNGSVLGPKTRNLNKEITYPSNGSTLNQLVALSQIGIISETITASNVDNYPKVYAKNDANASLEDKARTYLDVNCASCHNPSVDNIAMFDARYTTPLENQNIINGDVVYDEGLNNPKVIIPQDVANSMAHFRMNSTQTGIEMPPISKDVVDAGGVQLIEDWINSLTPTTSSPPVAVFSASTVSGTSPLSVNFDASASTDADNDPLTYSWDFGDGSTATGITTSHVFTNIGAYTVTLTVNDGSESDQTSTSIAVNNNNPGSNTVSFTDGTTLLRQDNFSGLPMGVIDMNGDGRDDIVQFNSARNLRIQYQNGAGQQFTTHDHGAVSTQNQWGTAIADFDQNGYNDVMSGGFKDNLKIIKNNNGNNSYSQSILPDSDDIFLQGANFADINSDGWADIFACHDLAESRAYQNNQNGTLFFNEDLISTETIPISDNSGNYASMWTDYDNDGDLDLYISKCRGGVTDPTDPRRINMLWQNDGNNNYNEVAAEANLKIGDQTWLSDFGDIDNDGDLDAIIINHGTGPNLMRNNGNGTFTEVTSGSGLLPVLDPANFYGIQGFFKDFNNDGFIDLMVSGDYHYIFYNNGDGTFQNATNPFNSNQIQSFSVGDINHDGFLDIYAGYATGLNSPSSTKDRIWLNNGNSNNFLNIQLTGTNSNINAIGARVELYGTWGIQIRDVRSGEGYGLVNSYTQHFGIGVNTTVDKVVVRWPSGNVDEIINPQPNQFLKVVESVPEPTCDDGLKNGDETGIDCGGSCTNSCPCEGEIVVSIDFENASASDWITSGTASTGTFIVADPTSQVTSGIITQLEDDHSPQGTNAFFTATNTSVGANDVDQGVSIATSPVYRITQDSELSIWYFFGQRDAGDDPDDYFLLEYSLDNGTSYTALASYGDETVNAQWTEAKAEIPQGSDLVLRVSASDGTSNGDIIEAGIDDFVVTSLCREPVLVTGIVLSEENISLEVGENITIDASVQPEDADDTLVNWSSSDENIANVNSDGTITAIAEGIATITATTNDGDFTANVAVTVTSPDIPVTGININPEAANLIIGETINLSANVIPQNATNTQITWSSSDNTIATVDANGVVLAQAPGVATISAITADGAFEDTSNITVEPNSIGVTGVTLNESSATLEIGQSIVLTATINPEDATDQTVQWSSSDETIATVDGNGEVIAVSEGTATITVTTVDGAYTADLTLTVDSTTCASVNLTPEYNINGQEYVAAESNGSITLSEGDWLILSVLPNDGAFSITGPNGNEKPMDINDLTLFNFSQSDTGIYTFTTEDGCTTSLEVLIDSTPVNCASVNLIPEYNINGQEYLAAESNGSITLSEGDWLILSVLPNDGAFSITGPNGNEKPMDINDLTLFNFSQSDTGIYTFTTEDGCTTTLNITIDDAPVNCTSVGLIPEYNINGQEYLADEDNATLSLNQGDWIILSVLPNDGAFSITGPNNKPMDIQDLTIFDLSESDTGTYTFTTENGCTTTLNLTLENTPLDCTNINLVPEYNINGQDYLQAEDNQVLSLTEGDWIILSILPNEEGAFSVSGANGNDKDMGIEDLVIFNLGPEDAGDYQFTTENGCTTVLTLQVVPSVSALTTITPLLETEGTGELSVFPNPSKGMVTIDLRSLSQKNVNITVYNSSGKIVHETVFAENHGAFEEMNLEQLSDGVYHILFRTVDKIEAKSLIIKK
ncbi:Ig-like domain-containing protein [Maribacter sp. R77961]|uniref:Ig-like domain-containing protein n=1 Tax=Maribacter sp. R77961 TaxID=3093871 RepID=UPI0037C734A3